MFQDRDLGTVSGWFCLILHFRRVAEKSLISLDWRRLCLSRTLHFSRQHLIIGRMKWPIALLLSKNFRVGGPCRCIYFVVLRCLSCNLELVYENCYHCVQVLFLISELNLHAIRIMNIVKMRSQQFFLRRNLPAALLSFHISVLFLWQALNLHLVTSFLRCLRHDLFDIFFLQFYVSSGEKKKKEKNGFTFWA